jgi:hypothetical protein
MTFGILYWLKKRQATVAKCAAKYTTKQYHASHPPPYYLHCTVVVVNNFLSTSNKKTIPAYSPSRKDAEAVTAEERQG